jgi:hypothetical protein
MWKSIHFIAAEYMDNPTSKDRQTYKSFFESLGKVLPCYKCSVNYKKHYETIPIDKYLSGPEALFEWTVMLHNAVNADLGKEHMPLSLARDIYSGKDIPHTFYAMLAPPIIGIAMIVMLAAYIAMRTRRKIR